MDTTSITILLFIAATVLGIFGYFLKGVHKDVKDFINESSNNNRRLTEELGRLKGKIELVEQESRLKYQAIQEQTQIELKNLAKNVNDLSLAVKELILNK
jgi:uncharacterized protein YoxC